MSCETDRRSDPRVQDQERAGTGRSRRHSRDGLAFRDQVDSRFAAWLLTQEQKGVDFTDEQRQWLTWMKENIASEMGITAESFLFMPFAEHGGIGKAVQIFGDRLTPITDELTEAGMCRNRPSRSLGLCPSLLEARSYGVL